MITFPWKNVFGKWLKKNINIHKTIIKTYTECEQKHGQSAICSLENMFFTCVSFCIWICAKMRYNKNIKSNNGENDDKVKPSTPLMVLAGFSSTLLGFYSN